MAEKRNRMDEIQWNEITVAYKPQYIIRRSNWRQMVILIVLSFVHCHNTDYIHGVMLLGYVGTVLGRGTYRKMCHHKLNYWCFRRKTCLWNTCYREIWKINGLPVESILLSAEKETKQACYFMSCEGAWYQGWQQQLSKMLFLNLYRLKMNVQYTGNSWWYFRQCGFACLPRTTTLPFFCKLSMVVFLFSSQNSFTASIQYVSGME